MVDMIATKPLKYPRAIGVGEPFSVDERSARALKLIGKAEYVKPQTLTTAEIKAEGEDDPQPKRRSYKRRDLRAED